MVHLALSLQLNMKTTYFCGWISLLQFTRAVCLFKMDSLVFFSDQQLFRFTIYYSSFRVPDQILCECLISVVLRLHFIRIFIFGHLYHLLDVREIGCLYHHYEIIVARNVIFLRAVNA